MKKAYELAQQARPTPRQLKWQENEFYALVSYGMPVFTGKQYGDGRTPASMFWPEDMDTDSWCETAKIAGMRGIVLTCKHYDGFCLWPSEYTDYSVKSSNWLDGEGDLVKMVADSCRRYGLKFGVYVAPWDRHEPTYGSGKDYDDFFCGLLTELLTNYGDVFCVWLDGVCGADEKRVQNYDWARYYQTIRTLAPDAAIAFCGPDVRWCGNEKGYTRPSEWSCVPAHLGVGEDGASVPSSSKKKTTLMDADIGSRKAIKDETEFIWYPCEVSVPMRAHWFFDEADKYSSKTKDKLQKLYYNTVGNNACLMLGLSPNKRGVLDETDTQILTAFGRDLEIFFGFNLLANAASITASSEYSDDCSANKLLADDRKKYWRPAEGDKKPELTVEFREEELFDKIMLGENIANGQHLEAFEVYALNEKGKWKKICEGETVGYKKICSVDPMKAKKLKFVFTEYRSFFELNKLQIN
ncbi:MAG: alpha-L-fucosidase [Clostridia bacterium]|nr:alpha-L-fucosidase [Clostridia bacterium]